MRKILKIELPQNCNGCELCVFEAQRQVKKIGLEGSAIRIFRAPAGVGAVAFTIDMDTTAATLDVEKIKRICPRAVFEIEDANTASGLTLN